MLGDISASVCRLTDQGGMRASLPDPKFIMENPFKIQKVAHDIYLITEPYFREHANLFLIQGVSGDLLVDAGLGLHDVKKFLTSRGFFPKVIGTHGHFDHIGGLRHFSAEDIIVSEKLSANIRKSELWGLDVLKPEHFDFQATVQIFGESPSEVCAKFSNYLPKIRPFKETKITIGGYELVIVPLPGHTDDSIVLHDHKNKLLITGDMLYDGELYTDFPNSDKGNFKKSLDYIKTLDFDYVLPGHNAILTRAQAMWVIDRWQTFL